MNIENTESRIENSSKRIAAVKTFMNMLKLDENFIGGKIVAVLVEYLAKKHPDNWKQELDKIMFEAMNLEEQESTKDAMFYLGDIINKIRIEDRKSVV